MKKYQYVTIEREHGSGGGEIGRLLASRLGYPCYGKEILEFLSRKTNIPVPQLTEMERNATSSLLYSIYIMAQNNSGLSNTFEDKNRIFAEEQKIIRTLAECGPAVFVGRGAAIALRDMQNVLNVFISAERAERISRLMEQEHLSRNNAEETLIDIDGRRRAFYMANTGKNWNDGANYHIILDSGKLTEEECVSILLAVLGEEQKRMMPRSTRDYHETIF